MDRVFLDANVLYAAAYKRTPRLRELWKLSGAELCSSAQAAEEAIANLREDCPEHLPDLERLAARLRIHEVQEEAASPPQATGLPAADRQVLAAAIAAKATHLVTGDKRHFGPLFGQRLGGVLILPPSEYLRFRS